MQSYATENPITGTFINEDKDAPNQNTNDVNEFPPNNETKPDLKDFPTD